MTNEELLEHVALLMLPELYRDRNDDTSIMSTARSAYLIADCMVTCRTQMLEHWATEAALILARDTSDLAELRLSTRTTSSLINGDVFMVSQLILCTENDLLKLPNFGRKSLNEVKQALAEQGMSLKPRKD